AIANMLQDSELFYGGGIRKIEKGKEMCKIGDRIVVGDIIYKEIKKGLKSVKIKECNK
ncbi:geranylgeranylglyceryl/heptaprenylglyceryl phosphate synthase, partial [Staphylococcus epidermidis]|uniref:geranylgeranylglyceryl/heptaprenylglyceryl phosphate synthase n=1 Tax=Staphylococcus epidermidis TaxID=1282 RepID=UPI0028CB94F2